MQQENGVDTFMYNVSRLAVMIPILIVVFVLSAKFMGFKGPSSAPQVAKAAIAPTQPTSQAVLDSTVQKTSAAEPKIDLKGPWVCNFSYQNSKITAYIKNKNIKATVTTGNNVQNVIVNGDCLYRFLDNEKAGSKLCGVSTWLSMGELLLSFNNIDSLMPLISSQFGLPEKTSQDTQNLPDFAKSCISQQIADSVFTIPKISFVTAQQTPQPQKTK